MFWPPKIQMKSNPTLMIPEEITIFSLEIPADHLFVCLHTTQRIHPESAFKLRSGVKIV
jgi:hypothetical protein